MDIFTPRDNIKPYEYPELIGYMDAIHKSFWTVDEFNFDADVKIFKTELSPEEKEAIKRCMLAISQVEVAVKSFWARLDMRMPKPEIAFVGASFGDSEARHSQSYSKLLERLGLNDDFLTLTDVPCMEGRVKYLKKYLKGLNSRSDKEFTKSLILFTLLVENVSLFSQFLVISSFYRYRNSLLSISKVITATAQEENLHGQFGAHLVNIIKSENPHWFDDEMENKIRRNVRKAFKAECQVLDWMFEKGELSFLPKDSIAEFLKKRFNYSLELMGYDHEFEIKQELLEPTEFFDSLIDNDAEIDFFTARSTAYSKGQDFSADNLF